MTSTTPTGRGHMVNADKKRGYPGREPISSERNTSSGKANALSAWQRGEELPHFFENCTGERLTVEARCRRAQAPVRSDGQATPQEFPEGQQK